MRPRILTTVAATAVAVAALAPAATATTTDEPTITTEAFTLDVTDGPDDEFTVTIDADRHVPDTATAATPAPVVLLAHGFGGNKDGYEESGLTETFADAGYVVVSYSSRGFGASTREIGLDSVDYDVKDVQQLIDEIATWDYVQLDAPGDPRIAMHGDSYGGGITLQVAAVDDRLDAIVPRITWSSLVYSLTPNNLGGPTASPDDQPFGIFKQQWTTLFFSLGTAQPVLSPEGFTLDVQSSECVGFVSGLCQTYARISAQGRGDAEAVELLQKSSPDVRAAGITAPAFIIQGQDDTLFNLRESVRNRELIAANGTPTKLLWFNGGHSGAGAPGETVNGRDPVDVVNTRILQWFEKYLRGDDTVDTGPALEYYRDWVEHDETSAADAYGSLDGWDAGTPTEFLLSGDGALVDDPGAVTAGELSFVNPPTGQPAAFSEDAARQAPFPPTEQPGQFAEWLTEPFDAPVEVVGIPTLELPVTSQTGEAHLHVRIYDVAEDGTETLVRRLTAPVYAEDLSAPLTISHPGFVHRFDAGDQLRLVVASTDVSYGNRQVPDQYTVSVDPAAPPVLTLPVVAASATDAAQATDDTPAADDATAAAPAPQGQLASTGGGAALLGILTVAAAGALRRRRD